MSSMFTVQVSGGSIHVSGLADAPWELRVESDKNASISKYSDISPHHPNPAEAQKLFTPAREMWFPVVDVRLEEDMEGVCVIHPTIFTKTVDAAYSFNPARDARRHNLTPLIRVAAKSLEHWENSLFVEMGSAELKAFYLSIPLAKGPFQREIIPLGQQWSGRISLFSAGQCTAAQRVTLPEGKEVSMGRDPQAQALEANLRFILASQNTHPYSNTFGSFYLFYDYAAQTWRQPTWLWGCGPAVNVCLQMAKRTQDQTLREQLIHTARDMGDCAIRHIVTDPLHPARNVMTVRYHLGTEFDGGACGFISPPDSGFFTGWALIPLYETTGDRKYLDAAVCIARRIEELMQEDDVIKQDYDLNWSLWASRTLDEAGFGVEGFLALFRATGDGHYQKTGIAYMDQVLEKLERPDGLWERKWSRSANRALPCEYYVRGLGWAMEGLLAAHELDGTGKYLAKAEKMANGVIAAQKADGSWNVEYDKPDAEVGVSEKGTALWSYLLYRLYRHSPQKKYLQSARQAMQWCLENQSLTPGDGFGGIPGISLASGVTYRSFFPLACSYTAGFFGLALLAEQDILKEYPAE